MKKYLVIPGLFILLNPVVKSQNKSCTCFYLTEKDKVLTVEKLVIENNRVEVLNDPSIIAPLFSMSEGMNGDMIQKDRRGAMIIAQCKDNLLKLKIKSKDAVEKPLPDMNVVELKQMNIRLNVTGGDGIKKAFLIANYEDVREDKGPVIDMFGGKLPVMAGDYIITTETKKATDVSVLNGKVAFKIKNGWIVVPVIMSDGRQADFVVDLAATSTVIDKTILPSSTQINKIEMVEYSANGAKTKNASMQGATGNVQEDLLLGKALLDNMDIGDMHISDVNASVLKL